MQLWLGKRIGLKLQTKRNGNVLKLAQRHIDFYQSRQGPRSI